MPMTVGELKEIVNIDVPGITITDLNQFTIVYVDSLGKETPIDDSGTLDVISSRICGDTLETYFVFIAKGVGENTLTYGNLKTVLDNTTDDTDFVYLLTQLQSIPPEDGTITPIESAVLDITRLAAVSEGGTETTKGVLTLSDVPFPPCSSSSSSSSSS